MNITGRNGLQKCFTEENDLIIYVSLKQHLTLTLTDSNLEGEYTTTACLILC